MAVIRDMMPVFELFQPASVEDATALLREHGDQAWVCLLYTSDAPTKRIV